EEITAGKTPTIAVQANQASRIMTGAPVPQGVDAVVMIERCQVVDEASRPQPLSPGGSRGAIVHVNDPKAKPGQHILGRAREMRVGEVVLHAGARLRPQEFGLLSSVGRTSVQAHPRPSV